MRRYLVNVYGRLATTSDPVGILVDVYHHFTAKDAAERFAKAIAAYLPSTTNGHPGMCVLVYALARGLRGISGDAFCYLSYDPGVVEVKRHAIPSGFYGCSSVSQALASVGI